MTHSSVYDTLDLEPLGRMCYEMAASSVTGMINLEDLNN